MTGALGRASFGILPALALGAFLAPWPSRLVERAFTGGTYAWLQPRLTTLANLAPFACLDVLIGLVLVAVLMRAGISWRRRRGAVRWALGLLARGIRACAVAYLLFLAAWGLNYQRTPAAERFEANPPQVGQERLRALVGRSLAEVNTLAAEPRDATRLEWSRVTADLRPAFASATQAIRTTWTVVPGRPKASIVAHAFPWAAVDGMVNPFALEVIVNPEVLPFERPFVLAHEWAHLAGEAGESEASFVGLLACWSGTAEARYSGWLSLLVHAWRGLPEAERRAWADRLAPRAKADLRAVAERVARAQPAVHAVSWQVYDRYLRANRVPSGVASYDEVTRLVLSSRLTASLAAP